MKKVKFLTLFIIGAMALLGGSYAAWSDHLTNKDIVHTGIVNLQWADGKTDSKVGTQDILAQTESTDPGPNYSGLGNDVTAGNRNEGPSDQRNIGYLDIIDGDPGDGVNIDKDDESDATWGASYYGTDDPRAYGDKITLKLGNGYPGYTAAINTSIINTGTVSTRFEISDDGNVPDWLHIQIKKADGTVLYDNHASVGDTLSGEVLDPTQQLPVVIVETVVGKPGAAVDKNASREFTLKLTGVQWNGYNGLPNSIQPDSVRNVAR